MGQKVVLLSLIIVLLQLLLTMEMFICRKIIHIRRQQASIVMLFGATSKERDAKIKNGTIKIIEI